jgi:hypothetical protein
LLVLLGAQTARAQSKPASESQAAPTGERVAEPVAPAPKQPDPAAPQPPTPAPAQKSVEPPASSVAPPASGPGPGLVPPLNPAHTDAQYPTTARVAITEFLVTGEETSRALAMRLQEGFAVGLTRTASIYVLDSVDVARYIDIFPELQKCEGSICIKRLGQMLDVSHILRVTVAVTGNSYDMTARLFSTEGLSPADVPIDTQTRFCPVCTVDEARQKITQLGEAIKNPVELWLAQQRPPPPPPPPPSSWRRPIAALGVALGFATIVGGGALLANVGHDNKAWPAVAGAMIGIGASAAALSCYLLIAAPTDPAKATLKVAIGGRF